MNTLEDPNQSGMEWRVLVAVVLSMSILFASQFFFAPDPATPLVPPETAREVGAPAFEVGDPPAEAITEAQPPTPPAEDTDAQPAAPIVMRNADMELTWSNVRGGLHSVRLLNFADDQGEGLEVMPQGLPDGVTRPLEVGLPGVHAEIMRQAVYQVEPYGSDRRLEMRFRKGSLEVKRTVRLEDAGYLLSIQTDVRVDGQPSPYSLTLGAGIGGEFEQGYYGDFSWQRIAYWSPSGVVGYDAGDLEGRQDTVTVGPEWVAIDSHYFSYALLSRETTGVTAFLEKSSRTLEDGSQEEVSLLRADVHLSAGAAVDFFVGPKYSELLAEVDPSLPNLIDYGFLAILVRPLVVVLKGVNGFIGNYGFSIIFLTFLINLVLFPIRYKQMVSMKKMSVIQPKLKAIQDKYKRMKRDDPRRVKMNEEVMAFYKAEGVNPLAGCLPLLVQMPFLFAFYQMLAATMELRGAPFILWIQDLSKADPYYITPIVMGATMVLQQKMTPMAGDPMQRRMMMFMPIMFTFFFLNVSSGLAIYFLFSNVFGMLLQYGFQQWGKEEPVKPSGKPKGKKKKRK